MPQAGRFTFVALRPRRDLESGIGRVQLSVYVPQLGQMTVYQERKDELERYEFMMGKERGRLAVTLDCITDALVLVGQHGVYCQSARQPGKPAMDIQIISKTLTDAKELIASVLEELKAAGATAAAKP